MASKIRVLHITKTLVLGGAEVNILNLLYAFDQNKLELHVAYSFGGELEPKFKETGVRLFKYADKDHKVKSLATIGILARLVQYILDHKIQIVHTHTFSAHIWGSIAAKLTGCKIVEHVHDYRYLQPEDFVRRRGFNNQYRFVRKFKNVSDKVIVLTKQNRDFLIQERIYPAGRVYEYQNGIPLNGSTAKIFEDEKKDYKQQLSAKFGLRPDALIVLTPIRIAPEKNADLIVRIAPKVFSCLPNTVFLIAGDGPLYQKTMEDISQMGLENNIKMIGYHSDIHFLLKGADVFLLPSFLELHSIAILEAMSMRVPVVISEDVGCNSEVIENWHDGVLLDPFKDEGWAEALIKLLTDQDLRKQIGDNGHKSCVEKFDIKDTVRRFEDLYVSLMDA